MIDGKILITGGTGSLGNALLIDFINRGVDPRNLTVLARNETKLNQTRAKFPLVQCKTGDVRDLTWLQAIFPGHDYVIHAGALKVVPTAEVDVRETVSTNVIGSMNVALAATESGVKRVIGVSTDKACEAQTQYGSSKLLMEGLFREADGWNKTSFNLVRYGNVLGSNQSVVPYFQSLVAQGKPITLTSGKMTRFWLSMLDALNLIWDALNWNESGVTLVPKAKASNMYILAHAVVPETGYPIIETGKRPGEKMHEKMLHSGEVYHSRDAGKYYVIYHPSKLVDDHLSDGFEYCSNTCEQYTTKELKEKIAEYIY